MLMQIQSQSSENVWLISSQIRGTHRTSRASNSVVWKENRRVRVNCRRKLETRRTGRGRASSDRSCLLPKLENNNMRDERKQHSQRPRSLPQINRRCSKAEKERPCSKQAKRTNRGSSTPHATPRKAESTTEKKAEESKPRQQKRKEESKKSAGRLRLTRTRTAAPRP